MRPEAPVICKRIDNTPLTIVTDNALSTILQDFELIVLR
jgi:hypothetical protein